MKKYFIYVIFCAITFLLCMQQSYAQADIGNVAPNFTLKALNGNEISLSKFKDKYVLIDFWGSWCGPCRKTNPLMAELYGKLLAKKANIEFISIACNEQSEESWKRAIENDKLVWTQLNDAHSNHFISTQYRVNSFPTCILVSPKGEILNREHPVTLINKVEKLFGIAK